MRIALRGRRLRVAKQSADDWQAERPGGADAGEAVTQIMKPQPIEPSGARHRLPRLLEIGARLTVFFAWKNIWTAGETRQNIEDGDPAAFK